jgi:hypothetical protein
VHARGEASGVVHEEQDLPVTTILGSKHKDRGECSQKFKSVDISTIVTLVLVRALKAFRKWSGAGTGPDCGSGGRQPLRETASLSFNREAGVRGRAPYPASKMSTHRV